MARTLIADKPPERLPGSAPSRLTQTAASGAGKCGMYGYALARYISATRHVVPVQVWLPSTFVAGQEKQPARRERRTDEPERPRRLPSPVGS